MKKEKLFFILILLFLTNSLLGQSLMSRIEALSKSVFKAIAYNENGIAIDSSMLFLTRSESVGVTASSIFNNDTVIIFDKNKKPVVIKKIIALHQFADLVTVELDVPRFRAYQPLNKSNSPFLGNEEIIIIKDAREKNSDFSYGHIINSKQVILLGRTADIEIDERVPIACVPVFNSKIELTGVMFPEREQTNGKILPVQVLSDKNWISVEQSWQEFKSNQNWKALTSSSRMAAIFQLDANKWYETAEKLNNLIQIDNQNSNFYAMRGFCYANIPGRNVDANLDYDKALKLNPNNYLVYYLKTKRFISIKDKNSALRELNKAIETNSDFAIGFYELGKIQLQNNEIQKAYASFTYSIKIDSAYAEAWYERGKLGYQHSSDTKAALRDLTNASYLKPELDGVFTLLGTIKYYQNDYMNAIREFDKAIQRNANDNVALQFRGSSHYNIGSKDKACQDWEQSGKKGNFQALKLSSRYCLSR